MTQDNLSKRISNYPEAIEEIANRTLLAYRMMKLYDATTTPMKAWAETLHVIEAEARDARKHTGSFQYGVTTEEIDSLNFLAMTVEDIRADIHRPRTGNIRSATMAAIMEKFDDAYPDPVSFFG